MPFIGVPETIADGMSAYRGVFCWEAGFEPVSRYVSLQAGQRHQGRGREIISLDWTLSHHEAGKHIYGVKRTYDYVNRCMSCFQTVVTAVIANPQQIDGIAVKSNYPTLVRRNGGTCK